MKLDQENSALKETKVSAEIRSAFDKKYQGLHQIRCMRADFNKRHEVFSHPSPLLLARNAVTGSPLTILHSFLFYIENNAWTRGDMEFIEFSTRYLTHSLR